MSQFILVFVGSILCDFACSTLYGISIEGELMKYDVKTGEATQIATPNVNGNPFTQGSSLGALDISNGFYTYLYTEFEGNSPYTTIYPFNLNDSNIKYKATPLRMIDANDGLAYNKEVVSNPITNDVYVWGHSLNDESQQLLLDIKFDIINGNGTVTQIANYSNIQMIMNIQDGDVCTFDSKRNTVWLPGTDGGNQPSYFNINILNGDLIKQIRARDYPFYKTGLYHADLDIIVGILNTGHTEKSYYSFDLVYIDPVTFQQKKSMKIAGDKYCSSMPVFSADFDENIFYQIWEMPSTEKRECDYDDVSTIKGQLIGINITDGSIVSNTTLCEPYLKCPLNIQFYHDGN